MSILACFEKWYFRLPYVLVDKADKLEKFVRQIAELMCGCGADE